MVTSEKKPIEDTQKKMRKGLNDTTTKNINETSRKIARELKRHKKTIK